LQLFSFGGYGLAHAALALMVFALSNAPRMDPPKTGVCFYSVSFKITANCAVVAINNLSVAVRCNVKFEMMNLAGDTHF